MGLMTGNPDSDYLTFSFIGFEFSDRHSLGCNKFTELFCISVN